jgi:hypothetical protein
MPQSNLCGVIAAIDLFGFSSRPRFLNREGFSSCVELCLEPSDRLLEILAPYDRCLRQGRISEMRRVVIPCAIFLGLNFKFELCVQELEIGDHCLKLGNLPPMLANMKILQAKDVDTPASMVRNVKILQAKELCM